MDAVLAVVPALAPVRREDTRRRARLLNALAGSYAALALAVAGFIAYRLMRLGDPAWLAATDGEARAFVRVVIYGGVAQLVVFSWRRPVFEHVKAAKAGRGGLAAIWRHVDASAPRRARAVAALHAERVLLVGALAVLALRLWQRPAQLLTEAQWAAHIGWDAAIALSCAVSAAAMIPGTIAVRRYRDWRLRLAAE